uniref:Placental growth factor n=1 Tax=Anser brachyrhynchus TaxID=132585 RepID=A0A8B9BNH3_9AVES
REAGAGGPHHILTFKEIWNRSFCRPLEQLVDVIAEFPNEVEYIFRPSCVALQRCGGCCGDEGLRCVPVETSTVTMQVSAASGGLGAAVGSRTACCRSTDSRALEHMPGQKGPSACPLGLSLMQGETSGGTDLRPCFPALSSVRSPASWLCGMPRR